MSLVWGRQKSRAPSDIPLLGVEIVDAARLDAALQLLGLGVRDTGRGREAYLVHADEFLPGKIGRAHV